MTKSLAEKVGEWARTKGEVSEKLDIGRGEVSEKLDIDRDELHIDSDGNGPSWTLLGTQPNHV